MPLTRLFATGLWLAATVVSTAVVWAATSIVAADVADRPAPVLAHDDVLSEVEAGRSGDQAPSPSTTTPVTDGPTSTVPASGGDPAVTSPGPRVAAPPSPEPRPEVTASPVMPPAPATTVPGAASPPPPPPPGPKPPSRPMATYSTPGGVVRVACSGIFIDLVSAIPSNGYVVRVVAGGPANVDVRFIGPGKEESVKAVCFGQPIRYYEQDPPRQPEG